MKKQRFLVIGSMKRVICRTALLVAAAAAPVMHAQVDAYTAKQTVRLQAFGMFSYVRPDFGGAKRNAGGAVGIDADIRAFGKFKPGLELRATGSGGNYSNQYTYGGGPRVIYGHARIQPYADFLLGYGSITLDHSADPAYTKDTSLVVTYGGGADFLINRTWAIKADVQSERWKLSERTDAFNPLAVSVGVRYALRFHNRNSPD